LNLFFISLCIRNTIEYVLGSCGLTVIDIEVLNGGEDALDAFATLTWTPADAFSFIKVLSSSVVDSNGKINDGSPIVVSCSSSPFVLSIVNGDDTTAASVGAGRRQVQLVVVPPKNDGLFQQQNPQEVPQGYEALRTMQEAWGRTEHP
jgi:hypothetical protein